LSQTDLSDVVRHVGALESNNNGSAGIEIYVDPMLDPEIGEIVPIQSLVALPPNHDS
jgi:hypothetical protein